MSSRPSEQPRQFIRLLLRLSVCLSVSLSLCSLLSSEDAQRLCAEPLFQALQSAEVRPEQHVRLLNGDDPVSIRRTPSDRSCQSLRRQPGSDWLSTYRIICDSFFYLEDDPMQPPLQTPAPDGEISRWITRLGPKYGNRSAWINFSTLSPLSVCLNWPLLHVLAVCVLQRSVNPTSCRRGFRRTYCICSSCCLNCLVQRGIIIIRFHNSEHH